MSRVIYVIMDGVGIGALPDAAEYGDEGSNTLGNVSRTVGLDLPFLRSLGLGNIATLYGVPPVRWPKAFVGRLAPLSVGKDSTVGHWEQMGLVTSRAFPTYPDGFPPEIITVFTQKIGRGVLGNRTASGTEIIAQLGDEHVATGRPIVYTSADSVFQVAAHVDVVSLETLYSWCREARDILTGRHGVARVIARPFAGRSGKFARTKDRKDLSLPPPGPTYLDRLSEAGVMVQALGKVAEIFAGSGIRSSAKVGSNEDNLALLRQMVQSGRVGSGARSELIITNLVDFDMVWGHRNDVEGFAQGLTAADKGLSLVADLLGPEDRLVITADHGVDPTTPSTDHSREYVPALVYPRLEGSRSAVYEGAFADAGAFTYEYLTTRPADLEGTSFSRLQPSRGWRRYTPALSRSGRPTSRLPGRVGESEAQVAADWLREHLGPPPIVAIVLGSGLPLPGSESTEAQVTFKSVPYWWDGRVPGHPGLVALGGIEGTRCAVVQGRVHEYEGADLSEVQLPIRTLAAWGVSQVILTTAAGAVADGLQVGDVVRADRVYDLQYRRQDGRPTLLEARWADGPSGGLPGKERAPLMVTHASVPGPQYETPAELKVLRGAGVATVSMSPSGELRAAKDEGMTVAVLAIVTNAGPASHTGVLAAAAQFADNLYAAVLALCRECS